MGKFFTEVENLLEASRTETGDDTGAGRQNVESARAAEFWVNVTAFSGFTGVDFIFETSLDGTNFVEASRITVTATGTVAKVINRADQAMGKTARVRWDVSGAGSITFEVRAGLME